MKKPQNEVKTTPQKLRPIKLSDEAFELFYKEIYAEFGPKDVPAFDPNSKKEIQEEVIEEVTEVVAEPVFEEAAEVVAEPVFEEVTEEVSEPVAEEESEEDLQEEEAKAEPQIWHIDEDDIMDDYDDGDDQDNSKKKKGVRGLVFTICLELLAIAGVVAYWLLYIL